MKRPLIGITTHSASDPIRAELDTLVDGIVTGIERAGGWPCSSPTCRMRRFGPSPRRWTGCSCRAAATSIRPATALSASPKPAGLMTGAIGPNSP